MKRLLLILLCLPMIGFGQLTMIPDANFEQRLISFGYDNILDGVVLTAAIDTVTELQVGYYGISDLTGIEDFTSLKRLYCEINNISAIDVSNNLLLEKLYCQANLIFSHERMMLLAMDHYGWLEHDRCHALPKAFYYLLSSYINILIFLQRTKS